VGFRAELIVLNDSATGMVGRPVWTDDRGAGTAVARRCAWSQSPLICLPDGEHIAFKCAANSDGVQDRPRHTGSVAILYAASCHPQIVKVGMSTFYCRAILRSRSLSAITAVRLNDLCRAEDQALARVAGRFRLVPI
jgi:hypothetical protein